MFKNIVLPLDGSFTAEKVMPWVQDYAVKAGSRVHLVRVIPGSGLTPEGDHDQARLRDDALRYLEDVSKRFRDQNVLVEIYVRAGKAAEVVIDVARKAHAGLIALTTRGSTTVRRGLFGGTAEKIIRMSPQALFVMHASEDAPRPPIKIKKILVPMDGSELSESILPTVSQLARWHEARLILGYVRPFRTLKDPQVARFDELCELLEKDGIKATHTWVVGDAATEILNLAQKKEAGLIAMNSHGRSGFTRFLLGSVTEEVVHGADVPVFLTVNRKPVPVESPKLVLAKA